MRASRAEERASKLAKAVQQADPADLRLMRRTGWGSWGQGAFVGCGGSRGAEIVFADGVCFVFRFRSVSGHSIPISHL